jgi:hypothetical protein
MFDAKSRYALLTPYQVVDGRGRVVAVVPVPDKPDQTPLGLHRRLQGQRLDHLAFHYLDDPAGFWRICELADAMFPDALAEVRDIPIPAKVQ